MPTVPHFVTVRDQRDSVWQSVMDQVAKRQLAQTAVADATGVAVAAPARAHALRLHLDGLIEAAHTRLFERDEMLQGRIPASLSLAALPTTPMASDVPALDMGGGVEKTKRCAGLALQLAKAKVFGPSERVLALQSVFDFSNCDPFWVRCIDAYVDYFQLHIGQIPYRGGLNNILPTGVAANAKIAVFGDWGTGTQEAADLLQQIKGFAPDILMHLGDVYYSGTQDEMQERFLNVCDGVFGAAMPARFSLSGNHDMYSGGDGYYWLVDQLGQKASYFAIQNDDWLFIGMDTGVNDYNPFQGGTVASFLNSGEAAWINQLVANKGTKHVMFFSHHPPFSAYDAMSGSSVNPVLLTQLQDSLPNVNIWFWGHEHRLGVYDPFQGVQRGRCLGHAAIPVFADVTGDPPKLAGVPVHKENGAPLDMGSADGIFKHGFAIMTLNGKQATVAYYRLGDAGPLWTETIA